MQWYLWRGGSRHGPYDENTISLWLAEGKLVPGDLLAEPGGEWLRPEQAAASIRAKAAGNGAHAAAAAITPEAASPSAVPQPQASPYQTPPAPVQPTAPVISPQTPVYQPAPPPAYNGPAVTPYPQMYPPTGGRKVKKYKKPRRKHKGAVGCLSVFLVFAILIGSGVYLFANRDSGNLKFGKRQTLVSEKVTSLGGEITFDTGSADGRQALLQVPGKAYEKETAFKISSREIKENNLGEHFNPITPLITIDNGHAYSAEVMTLTIPISISKDEFAMAFYYDRKTGLLEALPLVQLTTQSITVATEHFSDVAVSKIKQSELEGIDVDTGFEPGYDDWQFVNYGSFIEPGGHCAGQSITEMWYFVEKYKAASERRLYGRYDNNDFGMGTIDFWEDDSWGYRFASTIQNKIDWDSRQYKIAENLNLLGDRWVFFSFAYSMLLTKSPQFVAIFRYDADGNIAGGHAIVAYKIKDNIIYVADPNKPGVAGRKIVFNEKNNKFEPYSSAANAADLAAGKGYKYPSINYLAVSAMISWDTVGQEYRNMLDKKAGDGLFPAYKLELLTAVDPDTGEETWSDCPESIETDLAKTSELGPDYAGKLVFRVKCAFNNLYSNLYNETKLKKAAEITGGDGIVKYTVKLKKGVNDIGFYIQAMRDAEMQYIDFKRVKVVYETVDLSGTWEGEFVVTEAGNIINLIADWFSGVVSYLSQIGDEPVSREEARQNLIAQMESQLYGKTIPMIMVLTKRAPDDEINYDAVIRYTGDDGKIYEYETKLKYSDKEIKFSVYDAASSSRMKFSCYLEGNDTLAGTYVVHAWGGLVRNAYSGEWRVDKQKP